MGGPPKIKWDPVEDVSKAVRSIGSNIEKNVQRTIQDGKMLLSGNFNNLGASMLRVATMGYTGGLSLGMNPDDKKQLLGETGSERMEREVGEQAAEEEQTARAGLFNDALTDNSLDAKTRREIEALYQSGGTSADIASVLNAARDGKGIYGVRKLNNNRLMLMRQTPGRSQLTSLGRGTSLI